MRALPFQLPAEDVSINNTDIYSIQEEFALQGTDITVLFPSFPSYRFNLDNYSMRK